MDETAFLRLLLDEAPVAAFEREVQAGHDLGLDQAGQEHLREAGYLALQLRLILREGRRREAELAALYATAGDLIAIRDPQHVLQAIVRRARQLLDADTAYLTLNDDVRGDTYMRVAEGTVTPEFDAIRLDPGVGLGGLVAQTAMPWFTSDYFNDSRFRRDEGIDDAVAGEALRAILGVPLKLVDEVIGVLFVANRSTRPFSPDEVNLLASLAAHAAIAIENARLFDQAQQAIAELNATAAVVRAHSRAVERAAAAHERLTNIVLSGGSLDDIAAAVAELLDGTVMVVDPQGRRLAGATEPDGDESGTKVLGAAVTASLEHGQTVQTSDRWVAPVGTGSDRFGALVLGGRDELTDVDVRTLERAAQVTALVLLSERGITDAEMRSRGELLDDLLTGNRRDIEATRRRARRLGVDLDAPHEVLVASAPEVQRGSARVVAAGIAQGSHGLIGERLGTVVMLLPVASSPDPEAIRAELAHVLGVQVTAGVASAESAGQLGQAFDEADRCRRTLLALGRDGEVADAAALGMYTLLFNQVGRDDLDRFVATTIGPVLDWDQRRGTDLMATMQAFFGTGGNMSRAAADLHVHVNTLYQRSERIAQLLSTRWYEPQQALRIQLAVEVHRLRTMV